jgi:hypothetical protein
MMNKAEVERGNLISSRPLEEITTILEATIAHPNVAEICCDTCFTICGRHGE